MTGLRAPAGLALGDPRKAEPVVLGSVIGMGTVAHCNALIDGALPKGAKLVCGGKAEVDVAPMRIGAAMVVRGMGWLSRRDARHPTDGSSGGGAAG